MTTDTLKTTETRSAQQREQIKSVFTELISLNLDGANAYKTATELLENEQYTEICRDFAQQRNAFADELRRAVAPYGAATPDEESINGLMHDAWMNLRNLVDGNDTAVIVECDRSDERAIEIYHEMLDADLPADLEQVIRKQFSELKGEHERIHRLAAALQQH